MNSPAIILKELQELSPTLATLPRINVYSIPEGYFDNLIGELLLRLYTIDIEELRDKMSATVPEGYFENLAENIMIRIKNEDVNRSVNAETDSISPLVGRIGNKNIFSTPKEFFETFPGILLENIGRVTEENVFAETQMISPVVAGLGNKNVFSVPTDYFESLSINPVSVEKMQAKLINMQSRKNIFRYAVAAIITGIVAVSSFFIIDNNGGKSANKDQAVVMAEAKNILKTNSFDEKLASVSDEAIVNFLESKGQDVEAALVASLSDDKNLPAATDYLFNDETLDDVLKTIDLNN